MPDDLPIIDATDAAGFGNKFGQLQSVKGFIVHHTGGRGSIDSVINTYKDRNLPAQFVIDRNGSIYRTLPPGMQGQHIMNGWGPKGNGLSNANTEGVEIIANDDSDVLPIQQKAAAQLISSEAARWGFNPVSDIFGHGEVNPGHKEADEGMSTVSRIRSGDLPVTQVASQATPLAPTAGYTTKGSWFGNFTGQNVWGDSSDSGLQASGRPVSAGPGIALPSRNTLGKWFSVLAPNGQAYKLQQTDVGPANWTGRGVDINAPAAEMMGYTPKNFPTGGSFTVSALDGGAVTQTRTAGGTDWKGLLNNSLSAIGSADAASRPVINVNMGGEAGGGSPWNQLMQMSMVRQLMASGTHTVAPVEYDPWKGVTPAPAAAPAHLLPARYIPVNHDPFMETMV